MQRGWGCLPLASSFSPAPFNTLSTRTSPSFLASRAILHLLSDIEQHDREWSEHFELCGATPHVVVYEQLRTSLPETVTGILDFLGISTARGVAIPQLKRRAQSDDLSNRWAERFNQESRGRLDGVRGDRHGSRTIRAVADLP